MNVVAVIAVLSHETFLFFGFPVLVLQAAQGRSGGDARRLALGSLALAPILAAFAVTVVFRGSAQIAQAVNDSWSSLWARINPADCCMTSPGAAIDALQWSTGQALSYSARVLTDVSFGIYVPAAWAVTVLLCFWFMIGFQGRAEDARRLAAILIFQLAAVSPLFVLGWDFGRWIFLWTASSLMIHLFGASLDFAIIHKLTDRPAAALADFCLRRRPQPWQLLVFGVPSCCWSVVTFAMSTPPGFVARALGFLK